MESVELFPERPLEQRGDRTPDKDRVGSVIGFMADVSGGPLFRHKLHKLLFFADLLHLEEERCGITGLTYLKGAFGPVPERGDLLYEILVLKRSLKKKELRFPASDYFGTAFSGGEKAPIELAKKEKEVLEQVVHAYRQATPKMLIEESLRSLNNSTGNTPILVDVSMR